MKIDLISSPYDLGREGVGMALGPTRYLNAGVDASLSERGFEVEIKPIKRRESFAGELDAVSEVSAALAERVREAVARGSFPLVLGGNCDTAIGVLAGLDPSRIGVIWFDAHGDFGTPETTPDGYLGSMPLSTITGHCHEQIRQRAGSGATVPEKHVVMAGVRAAEPDQRLRLNDSDVRVFSTSEIGDVSGRKLQKALESLRKEVEEVYIHLDIDSLDPEYAPGVDFPAEGGLSPVNVENLLTHVAQHFEIAAASITAFNPEKDHANRTLHTGMRLIATLAKTCERKQSSGDS